MNDYYGIDKSLSGCVHFARGEQGDELREILSSLERGKVACAYVSYAEIRCGSADFVEVVAEALMLENRPYGKTKIVSVWIRFLDDLISLAHSLNGLVVVIDGADELLREKPNDMFDLIESFLIQFHHWFSRGKPCHLCFQMEGSAEITNLFLEYSRKNSEFLMHY